MTSEVIERNGVRIMVFAADGPLMGSYSDATDLIGDALTQQVSGVAIPAARLDPAFFKLSSGVAGEFIQKVVQYRLKLAVVGDISTLTARSEPLRDFVRESNRGRAVFFVPDLDAAVAKLAAL